MSPILAQVPCFPAVQSMWVTAGSALRALNPLGPFALTTADLIYLVPAAVLVSVPGYRIIGRQTRKTRWRICTGAVLAGVLVIAACCWPVHLSAPADCGGYTAWHVHRVFLFGRL